MIHTTILKRITATVLLAGTIGLAYSGIGNASGDIDDAGLENPRTMLSPAETELVSQMLLSINADQTEGMQTFKPEFDPETHLLSGITIVYEDGTEQTFNTQDMNIELILDGGLTIGDISASNQTEMVQKLNIPDALARYYASFINKAMSRQGSHNHAFYQNFVNAVNVVNYFVYQGDIDSRQGWLVIFRIIDADMLKKYPNLFQESETALAQNADLKGFYHKGNKHVWQSQGAQGMIGSDDIIQYADMSNHVPTSNSGNSNNSTNSGTNSNSSNSTNSGNSSNTGTTTETTTTTTTTRPRFTSVTSDDVERAEEALQQAKQNLLDAQNQGKAVTIERAIKAQNAGVDVWGDPDLKKILDEWNITPDDLK